MDKYFMAAYIHAKTFEERRIVFLSFTDRDEANAKAKEWIRARIPFAALENGGRIKIYGMPLKRFYAKFILYAGEYIDVDTNLIARYILDESRYVFPKSKENDEIEICLNVEVFRTDRPLFCGNKGITIFELEDGQILSSFIWRIR